MSSPFLIAILNGTFIFSETTWSKWSKSRLSKTNYNKYIGRCKALLVNFVPKYEAYVLGWTFSRRFAKQSAHISAPNFDWYFVAMKISGLRHSKINSAKFLASVEVVLSDRQVTRQWWHIVTCTPCSIVYSNIVAVLFRSLARNEFILRCDCAVPSA